MMTTILQGAVQYGRLVSSACIALEGMDLVGDEVACVRG
jgi:hypothetical protein